MPGRLASKTVSAIHAMPNTAITAIMPARNTSFLPMAAGSVCVSTMISAPASSMNIWMVRIIDSGLPATSGRSDSNAPSTATRMMAPTKIHIATHWPLRSCLPTSVVESPYTRALASGSAMSAWNAGSLSRSLPRNQLKMPIASTPSSVEGMVTDSSVRKPMVCPSTGAFARKAASETTATDTGLARMPIWLAIDAPAIGRSGRMLFLIATS